MRRTIFIAAALLLTATAASAAPLLFEAYQEAKISIPGPTNDTLTVTQVSFSIDTACYVQFATGGFAALANFWLMLDGDSLPPSLTVRAGGADGPIPLVYTYLVTPGEHTVCLKLGAWAPNASYVTTCEKAYLQAFIFLPDAGGAIAERPAGDVDADATGEMKSVISKGPYVTVTGATELVDATGRVIENAITDDRVSINALPQGTYFARDGERTVVKIVKVE